MDQAQYKVKFLSRSHLFYVTMFFVASIILTGCQANKEQDSSTIKNVENFQETLPASSDNKVYETATSTPTVTKSPTAEPASTTIPMPSEAAPPEPTTSASPKLTSKPTTMPEAPVASNTEKQRKQIDAKYEKKFSTLQTSCKAKVSSLSGEVKAYIQDAKAADKEVTVSDLQKNFMGKISSAEAGCDKSFNGILADAKQEYENAGLDPSGLDKWSQMYSQSKNEARRQALAQIIAAWKAGSN